MCWFFSVCQGTTLQTIIACEAIVCSHVHMAIQIQNIYIYIYLRNIIKIKHF